MPGIIVSRPIFNTLFKLAHEQGLSINAFLTKLLESSGQAGLAQAVGDAGDVADELVSGAEVPAGVRGAAAAGQVERATTVAAAAQQVAREAAAARQAESPARPEPVYAQAPVGTPAHGHEAVSHQPAQQPGFASAGVHLNGASAGGYGTVPAAANGHSAAGDGHAGDGIWGQVVAMAGKSFATSRGKKFSYKISGEYVIVKESDARIPRSQFEKAQQMWPVSGPSRLVGVYAPSVVWSIMKQITGQSAA